MAHIPLSRVLMYDLPSEIKFIQEDLRYNRIDLTWNSRWVNDAQTFGYGFGHVETGLVRDPDYGFKIRNGCRMELRTGWHDFVSIFEHGDTLASIRLLDNPKMSQIEKIHATDFDKNCLRLHHLDADAIYNGPPVGTHLLGDGRDGALLVTKPNTIINTYTHITQNVLGGDQIIKVESTDGFKIGDEILLLQTQYSIEDTQYYGNFEFHYVGEIVDGTTLKTQWKIGVPFVSDVPNRSVTCNPHPCLRYYVPWYIHDSPARPNCNCYPQPNCKTAQVIRIPHYSAVRIYEGGSITGKVWDGSTGGFIAFRCNGQVDMSGSINADAIGFRGSFSPPTYYFDGWGYTSNNNNTTMVFATFYSYDSRTPRGWGSTGEGCHGYGTYRVGSGVNGIGGAGSCGSHGGEKEHYQYPPGSGGSFGSRGGDAFKRFDHWECGRDYYGNCHWWVWYTYVRSYAGYTICDDSLLRMTLGTGGGGTMYRLGGRGAGGILIFCKEMRIRKNIGIYARGGLGSLGSSNASGGGHGSGGPIVLSVTRKLINEGTIDCGGAHYLDGVSGMGGYGGDGRLVWDVREFEGNSPVNWGSFHVPKTVAEAVRWGKLPLNTMDTLLIPYYTSTTTNNAIDISDMKRLDSIQLTYTYPHLVSRSEIRIAICFNDIDWVMWNGSSWSLISDLRDLGRKGMTISTLHSLTSNEFFANGGFTQSCKKLNIAVSLMTGIRLDSPQVFKVTVSGKIRSWRLWKVEYPRQISNVKVRYINSFMHQL